MSKIKMKSGIFANTNGNFSRLERTINKLIDEEYVNYIFCLGNFISPIEQMGSNVDKNSVRSLEILDQYVEFFRDLTKKSGKDYALSYFKGKNEQDFISREYHENRRVEDFYIKLTMNCCSLLTVFDTDRVFLIRSDPRQPIRDLNHETLSNLNTTTRNYLADLGCVVTINYVCFINDYKQGSFKVNNRGICRIEGPRIMMRQNESYIVSPSSMDRGYVVVSENSLKFR